VSATALETLALTIGDDRVITLTARTAAGALVDLTGYTYVFKAQSDAGTITKSIGAGITILDQTSYRGQCQVSIDAADWTPWAAATTRQYLRYEVQRTLAGKIYTPPKGLIYADPQDIV
jgi:hypothetical protein